MTRKSHGNALQEGFRLHWYRIGGVLGQGGFGITYLATDTNLDKTVAIKEYLPIEFAVREGGVSVHPFTEDRRQSYLWGLERFLREARTLARFVHPNIVRVFAVFEANNTAYMVMEYEQGSSLDDLFKFGSIADEASLLRVVHPLLDGLEHVHELGFIHRDIKPENIYVRGDGSPVLLDFGSARMALGVETRTLTSVVSPGFAPYEQYYSEEGRQGPWTDVYGLGATLYAALNHGQGPLDALVRGNARIENKPDPLQPATTLGRGRYSETFLAAIDAALAFAPEQRPQTIAAWREMLPAPDEAPGVPEAATRLNPAATDAPPARAPRRRVSRGALVALVILALGAAGTWYWNEERAHEQAQQSAAAGKARAEAAERERVAGEKARADAAERARAELEAKNRAAAETRAVADAAEVQAPGAEALVRDTLQDGSPGPQMVRIPAGRMLMGSPPAEVGRGDSEGPPHAVTIAADFALGKFEVTVGEFRRFVDATGFRTVAEKAGGCFAAGGRRDGATWRDPGFKNALSDDHPVVCVAWKDAIEYARWMSAQTGARYRLPSEAEWEYAVRAGTTTARYWGDDPGAACRHANVGDAVRSARGGTVKGTAHRCRDGAGGPTRVGRFEANAFGLHDMVGNVWEWTADCWRESYAGAPADGSAVTEAGCRHHARRGGNYASGEEEIRSAAREKGRPPGLALGFRVARDL